MISVALCTYNGEEHLIEQLASIAGQTILPGELVACDDCSSDNTINILKDFAAKVSFPVHIHINQANLGSTKNFEKAVSLCKGEIIFLSDQDDFWKTNKIERLKSALENCPEAGYVFSDAELTDQNLQPLGAKLWDSVGFGQELRGRFASEQQTPILLKQKIVTGATMAFRSKIAGRAIPFPDNWVQDAWIAQISSATGAPGLAITEPLIFYRLHAGQQIGASREPIDRKKSLFRMFQELRANRQALFADWERHVRQVVTLKDTVLDMAKCSPGLISKQDLDYIKRAESHFSNRREILATKHPRRYWLILREMLSGRYAQFSNSWRSIFRDLFL